MVFFVLACNHSILSQACSHGLPQYPYTSSDGFNWGIEPTEGSTLPDAQYGQPYTFTFYFKAPKDLGDVADEGFSHCSSSMISNRPCWVDIDTTRIAGVYGLSSIGLSLSTSNDPSRKWLKGTEGCAVVSGTPTNVGTFNIRVVLEGIVKFAGVHKDSFTLEYTLNVNPPPCSLSANAISSNETSIGAYDGQASVTPSGGTPPYEYQWSHGGSSSQAIGLTTGTYTVTISDQTPFSNCEVIKTIEILSDSSANPLDPCLNFSLDLAIQNETSTGVSDGSAEALLNGGLEPYIYNWSTGGSSQTINNLSQGAYSISVTDANNCSLSQAFIIQTDTTSNPTDTTTQNNPCSNFIVSEVDITDQSQIGNLDGSIQIAVDGGAEPFNITWSNADNTLENTNLEAGAYWVFIQDNNGCVAQDTFEVGLLDSTNISCDLGLIFNKTDETDYLNNGLITAAVNGGQPPFSYTWSNGAQSQEISGLSPGTYIVTASDADLCEVIDSMKIFAFDDTTCNLHVSQSSIPEITPGSNDGVASILVNGGTAPYKYNWNTGAQTSTIYNLNAGTYFVTVIDAEFCTIQEVIQIQNGVLSNADVQLQNTILVYPNPTKDKMFTIDMSNTKSRTYSVEIFDILRKNKTDITLNENQSLIELNTEELKLKPGLFILSFSSQEGIVYKKLIVE